MRPPPSLRFQVAVAFAWFGALVSLALSVVIYFAAQNLGQRLMDETLRAELEDYLSRRQRNPRSLPPATVSLRGYIVTPGTVGEAPRELIALPPGTRQPVLHNVTLDNTSYRSIHVEQAGETVYLLFNTKSHGQREELFFQELLAAVPLVSALAAWMGWLIAGRITSPITQLASQVVATPPDTLLAKFDSESRQDEVGDLARAFASQLLRLRAFIHRERAFTADVSHELRTPLSVIRSAAEVMLDDASLPANQRQRLSRIERSAQEMTGLITALLVLAREENTHHASVDPDCPMQEVILEVLEKFRYLIERNQVTLEVEHLALPILHAARPLAGVVVGNLVGNAITHTREGKVSIQLYANRLLVSDAGSGIRQEELQYIFKNYYRGTTSTGYGIGLSLVKRICDLYGWEILVESSLGQGTRVELRFSPSGGKTGSGEELPDQEPPRHPSPPADRPG